MTSRLENYAQWLVDNESKRGTPEFDTVARAYKALRGQPQEVQAPQPPQERTWGEAAKDVGACVWRRQSGAATGSTLWSGHG